MESGRKINIDQYNLEVCLTGGQDKAEPEGHEVGGRIGDIGGRRSVSWRFFDGVGQRPEGQRTPFRVRK